MGGQPPVADAVGGGQGLVKDPAGPLGLDVEDQHLAQVGEQLAPAPVALREQGDGPLQQVGGGRQVAPAGGRMPAAASWAAASAASRRPRASTGPSSASSR